MIVPVYQALDDRHLSLLELLLGKTASSVRKVNSVTDLNVICERDVLHLNTVNYQISALHFPCLTHSWVSHFPKSLTSWPSLEISFGSVVAVAILKDVDLWGCWVRKWFNDEQRGLSTDSPCELVFILVIIWKSRFEASDISVQLYSSKNGNKSTKSIIQIMQLWASLSVEWRIGSGLWAKRSPERFEQPAAEKYLPLSSFRTN